MRFVLLHFTSTTPTPPPNAIDTDNMALLHRVRSQSSSRKLTLLLVITCITLLVVLGIVLGTVTVPRFRQENKPTSHNAGRYAVVKENFPDPCIIQPGSVGQYYAFATRNKKVNIQIASTASPGISNWTYHDGIDALPNPGKWTATKLKDTQVWAPSVMETISGSFIMYYSALSATHTRLHCVGAATSPTIMGPYTPHDEPMICGFDKGGAIDPHYFHDPATNTSYLIYKADGNAIGVGGACQNDNAHWPNTPTPIMAVELNPDLTTLAGEPFEIISNMQVDGPNIESPVMWYYEYRRFSSINNIVKTYHLAFNAGCFHDRTYRIEHIVCIASDPTIAGNANWTNPGSPRGIRDCSWQRILPSTQTASPFAATLLQSGDIHGVIAPGGPALTSSTNGGVGDGNINKQYMVFHADINDQWYGHEHIAGEEQKKRGWERKRGMFVAELAYGGEEDMVVVKGLVDPLQKSEGGGSEKGELVRRHVKGRRGGHRRFH